MSYGSTVFDMLLVGLAAWLQKGRVYPFPALFQQACHTLALHLVPYPKTMSGLLQRMQEPVRSWWPLPVPPEFDADFGLTYEGQLSEEASRYLYQELYERAGLSPETTAELQQISLENFQFKRLIDRLRSVYDDDPQSAQDTYVRLRSFLIQHPYATRDEIADALYGIGHISAADIGGLYGDDLPSDQKYWMCGHCGPLTEQYGRLRGINAVACADHRTSLSSVHRVPWRHGLRRITPGIHARTCLPGLPEMRLFESLEVLRRQHPSFLIAVRLWPGIDRYDIRLEFADGSAWAADMKDYRSPDGLGPHLVRIYGEGSLQYDKSFYVIPMRRLVHENYIQIACQNAKSLPVETSIVSEIDFERQVAEHINLLRKG